MLLPIWTVAIFAIGYLLHFESTFFVWLSCCFLLFIVIDPWYMTLRRRRFSSWGAAGITVLIATAISAVVISLFLYMSNDVYQELESSKNIFFDYYNNLADAFKEFMTGLTNYNTPTVVTSTAKDAMTGKIIPKVQVVETSTMSEAMSTTLWQGVGSVLSILVYVFLWPVMTFFMLSERDHLASRFKVFFKDEFNAQSAWTKMVRCANAYFLGNFLLLAITIPVFVVLFLCFPIKNFITLAIVAAVINTLPFVGAVLTGVLPALQVLGESHNPLLAFWVYLLCLIIHFLLANFITPKILGARVNLNATTSTIALMAWSLLWGGMGLLLAIPITAMIKILLESSSHPQMRWLADLMDNPRK